MSRPLADTIRRTAVEVAMKTHLVPHHFDQPVDELEFALNGMIQLHEDQLTVLRQRIEELELQLSNCTCTKSQSALTEVLSEKEREKGETHTPLDVPIGGLDSDQVSVMSDSSFSPLREFSDWDEYLERHILPPYGLNSPVIDHLLQNWTTDVDKVLISCSYLCVM
jgi:hypothetical protein